MLELTCRARINPSPTIYDMVFVAIGTSSLAHVQSCQRLAKSDDPSMIITDEFQALLWF